MQYSDEIWKKMYDKNNNHICMISNYGRIIKPRNQKNPRKRNNEIRYHSVTINNIHYSVHRMVMYYFCTDRELIEKYYYNNEYFVDHIDTNKLNNHISNLRFATNQQNQHNNKKVKGYCFDKNKKDEKKYKASIRINGKLKHLGYFASPKYAKSAYQCASIKYFGEFSPWNISGPKKIKPIIIKKK